MVKVKRHPAILAWIHLMRVHDKMNRHLMDHLRHHELTLAQFDVLAQLTAAPGISQQELAERLFVTKGNVCVMLDLLEEKRKLVERRPDPDDRRAHLLFLTDKGQNLINRVLPDHNELVAEHMSALSEDEQHELLTLLRSLDRSLHMHEH